MTYQDTCTEGFAGFVKDQMVEKLRDDLSELVSNCLAGVPIQNQRRRRRLMEENSDISAIQDGTGFPKWLSRRERSLLQMPVSSIQADIIVSQDGSDTYKTIKNSPDDYLREGRKIYFKWRVQWYGRSRKKNDTYIWLGATFVSGFFWKYPSQM